MKLLFVRHGQTDWNVKKLAQGQKDIMLNDTGIEQAKTVREKLKFENIDAIFSSPLKRAAITARIINEYHNLQIDYTDFLKERNFGPLEGNSFNDDEWYKCWNYDMNTEYENGECVQDFFKRIHIFLDEIAEKYAGKTVLLVSHGGVSMAVDAYFNGTVHGNEVPNLFIKNCDVVEYSTKNN